jgi:hypothetical protein
MPPTLPRTLHERHCSPLCSVQTPLPASAAGCLACRLHFGTNLTNDSSSFVNKSSCFFELMHLFSCSAVLSTHESPSSAPSPTLENMETRATDHRNPRPSWCHCRGTCRAALASSSSSEFASLNPFGHSHTFDSVPTHFYDPLLFRVP